MEARQLAASAAAGADGETPLSISVVIPAYNYAHYVRLSLQSILAQTYPHLEAIVVDDGSTDGTAEAVREFAGPRVRYIHQENAGLSAARNTGIRHARFPWVAFLDADDLWRPEFLQSVVNRLAQLDSSFAAVATATARMDADGNEVPMAKLAMQTEGELTTRDFITRNRPLSSSVVVRRDVFEKCGYFDTSLRSSEDRDMWIRITAKGHRFWFINEQLGLIRRHGANMSANADRMKRNSWAVIRKAFVSSAVPKTDILFWLRAFSVHFFQISWTHFDAGLRARAFRYLFTSLALWPIFWKPKAIFERPLFRLRSLLSFSRQMLRGTAP